LGRELEAFTDRPGGGEIEDAGEDLHLGAAEGAEQRIDLVDAANQLRPAQPRASGELVVILAARGRRGVSRQCGLAPLAAGRCSAWIASGLKAPPGVKPPSVGSMWKCG